MRRVRAHLWLLGHLGLPRYLRYQAARREGVEIDYGKVLTADERTLLEERMESVPWRSR